MCNFATYYFDFVIFFLLVNEIAMRLERPVPASLVLILGIFYFPRFIVL